MKKTALILLGVWMPFSWLAAWKVFPEDGDKNGTIKSIQIIDDRIIVVTANGTHDLKLDRLVELLSNQPNAPQGPAAREQLLARVTAALKANPASYVFSGRPYAFKVMGAPGTVKTFREGDIFRGAVVDGRLYLQDQSGAVYESTWEIGFDFTRFVIPVDIYLKRLDANLEKLRFSLSEREKELAEKKELILFYTDQIVKLLKGRNYTTGRLIDKDGNIDLSVINNEDVEPNAMLAYRDLRYQLNRHQSAKARLDKEIASLKKNYQAAAEQRDQFKEILAARAGVTP